MWNAVWEMVLVYINVNVMCAYVVDGDGPVPSCFGGLKKYGNRAINKTAICKRLLI
jgi:hypothetical protein